MIAGLSALKEHPLMDFAFDQRTQELCALLLSFMEEHVYPAEPVFARQLAELDDRWAWDSVPVLAELRAEAQPRPVEPVPARRARRRADEPAVRAARRDHRAQWPGACRAQLLGARYRQHGGARAVR